MLEGNNCERIIIPQQRSLGVPISLPLGDPHWCHAGGINVKDETPETPGETPDETPGETPNEIPDETPSETPSETPA